MNYKKVWEYEVKPEILAEEKEEQERLEILDKLL